MKKNVQPGFTLVELMVVIGIVAVLVAIALPAYSDYTRKARRSDAKVALTTMAQGQDSHYADYLRYASQIGQTSLVSSVSNRMGCKTGCFYDTVNSVAFSEKKHYAMGIYASLSSRSRYVLTATVAPKGTHGTGAQNVAKETEKCQIFALSSRGVKAAWGTNDAESLMVRLTTAPDADPNDCWGD